MASEFDQYVDTYKDIINRGAAITGESFEYFIRLRLRLVAEELIDAVEPPPARILDFGCGIGETEKALRKRFPEAKIDGIDSSPESIKAAKGLGLPDVTFHYSDHTSLPFPAGSFDLIYSNGTFHHIDHREHPDVVGELVRVLRPGGHLFVFENNPLNPLTVLNMRRNPFDQGAKMLSPWYLRRLEREAGLRVHAPRFYVFFPKHLKALRFSEKHLRRVPLGAQYYVWGIKTAP
jgi:ubiquinone/menaquinone biosynthesis C-methylase UbiE